VSFDVCVTPFDALLAQLFNQLGQAVWAPRKLARAQAAARRRLPIGHSM
jgi:hypothetical protein